MPQGKKLTPDEIRRALELQDQGRTQTQIARALGISQRGVSRVLSRINAATINRMLENRAAERGRVVRQLARVASEAFGAWQSSGEDGHDHNYLKRFMEAIEAQRELLGLDEPKPKAVDPESEADRAADEAFDEDDTFAPDETPQDRES